MSFQLISYERGKRSAMSERWALGAAVPGLARRTNQAFEVRARGENQYL